MAVGPNKLRDEVLALPKVARAKLAAELLVSLENNEGDDLDQADALWAHEIENRARRAIAGDATGQDWIAVRQRVSAALAE